MYKIKDIAIISFYILYNFFTTIYYILYITIYKSTSFLIFIFLFLFILGCGEFCVYVIKIRKNLREKVSVKIGCYGTLARK